MLQKDLIKAVEQRGKCDDILKILVDYQKMLFESSKNCSQAAADEEAKRRQQTAAAKQKKSEIYRTFTDNFKDQTALLFGNGSLVDTIQALATKESMLMDIEFASSPAAYDKASSLFEIARQSIACAWNEANRPDACNEDRATDGNHPNDKYNNLYASLKKQMSADIRSSNR